MPRDRRLPRGRSSGLIGALTTHPPRAVALLLALAACGTPGCRGGRETRDAAGQSLLLVTIDTLRADRVGAYGATLGATPNLDALARGGLLFEEALASTPLTLPSHATILTGLEPPHHGVRDNGGYVLDAARDTLATRLKAGGRATGAFVAAYVLDRRFGLARGFDVYDDRIERRREGASVLESERRCGEVAAAAAGWIARQTGPFFAWAHFYEPHAPYDPEPGPGARFPGDPYAAEVAAADACLGRVLEAARQRAGDALVIAVVSDHGEGLGDHGESTHGLFVYQSTLRVPLVLAGAGIVSGERRQGIARTTDVVPTLLARLGVAVPRGLDGADLLAQPAGREAYAESFYPASFGWAPLRAFRRGPLKLIEAPTPELYDLGDDPGETRNLAAARPADVDKLSAPLRALGSPDKALAPGSADPEVRERLAALGYVTGGPPPSGPRKDPKDALPLWQAFETATAAEARGDRDTAIAGLRELVRRDPANTTFRRSLASAYRHAGRRAEAVTVLGDLEKTAPDDAVAWHERSAALAALGKADEAIRAEQRAVALDPSQPEPWNHLGGLLAERGRFGEALAALERATSIDPTSARAWTNRANVLRALRRADEAAADYRRASDLDPRDPDPANGMGVLLAEQGQLDAAAAAFEKAIALDPRHHEARLNLAVAEAQRGRLERARELASAVAREAPQAPAGRKARQFLDDLRSVR